MGTALTCGTDFKAYRQGHPILLNNRIPSPFGHEIAGSIFELGDGVSQFYLGQRVVAANSAPCDGCYYCQLGYPNLCEHLFLLNGAYAQYLLIPKQIVKHNMYRIPDEIPFKVAAMTEPLACVVRAVDQMNLTKGQTLAILGCGLMGLFFIQIAKRMGAQVIAIGRSHAKLEYAKSLGADHVLSVLDHENPMEKALDLTPGKRGFDCVVEAIGQPETWKQAITLARKGGSVCLYGGCAKGSSFALDTHRVHYQELKVFGVFHHTPKHFAKALDYLCKGIIEADIFVRNEVSLDELPHHFAREVDRPFAKVAVLP
jgi:L-iditol 2-dehydrogenase